MDSRKIGEFIAARRKENSMTQKELAEKLNVTNKAVSKWETGEGYPEITIIPALAEVLGVTIDELFRGERSYQEERGYNGERSCQEESFFEAKAETNKTAQEEYFLNTALMKFKNFNLLVIGLAMLGVIAFFTITLSTYYEILGFGVEVAFLLVSCVLFKIAYNQFSSSLTKFREMYPESTGYLQGILYMNKAITSVVWLVVLSISAAMPYILLDEEGYAKSIITRDAYLTTLPVFLIIGCGIAWVLTQYAKLKLNLKGSIENKNSIRRSTNLCIASDIYLAVLFLAMFMLSHLWINKMLTNLIFFTGIILYFYFTVKFVFKLKREFDGKLLIILLVRNFIIGYAIAVSISRSVYSIGMYGGPEFLRVDWSKLGSSLGLILIMIIIFSLLMNFLEEYLGRSIS